MMRSGQSQGLGSETIQKSTYRSQKFLRGYRFVEKVELATCYWLTEFNPDIYKDPESVQDLRSIYGYEKDRGRNG